MLSNRWIELRKPRWSRLESLLRQTSSNNLKSFSGSELQEFGLLYRQTAADLSAVREDETSRTLEAYLNRLLSQAHNLVYSGRPLDLAALWNFFTTDFPRLFRRTFTYTLLSCTVCLAGVLLGAVLTHLRPAFMHAMLGPQMVATIEHHKMWTDSILSIKPMASSAIMTNNISVCFFTFALGITGGLFTLYSLFQNGLSIGTVVTACMQHGMGLNILSFMAAHGALEIPSIFIAGGAGLRLAAGLLFPGMLQRKNALAQAGAESVRLIAGTIPLLFVAGLLEAFLSPTRTPNTIKFVVCATLLAALTYWLTQAGRRRQP